MKYEYNQDNVFAKIIRKEIPCKMIYEDEKIIAFYDINPVANIHALVIPKGEFIDFHDFVINNDREDIAYFFRIVSKVVDLLNIRDNFKIVSNVGHEAGQVIKHFHVHLVSNKKP